MTVPTVSPEDARTSPDLDTLVAFARARGAWIPSDLAERGRGHMDETKKDRWTRWLTCWAVRHQIIEPTWTGVIALATGRLDWTMILFGFSHDWPEETTALCLRARISVREVLNAGGPETLGEELRTLAAFHRTAA